MSLRAFSNDCIDGVIAGLGLAKVTELTCPRSGGAVIPTLSEWGMIFFSAAIALSALLALRRRTQLGVSG